LLALSGCDTGSSNVHVSRDKRAQARRDPALHDDAVARLRQELGLNVQSVSVGMHRTDIGIWLKGPLVDADSEYAALRRVAERLWTMEPFTRQSDTIAIGVTRSTRSDSVTERNTYFYYRSEPSSKVTRNHE
jgi:hypothetical protein